MPIEDPRSPFIQEYNNTLNALVRSNSFSEREASIYLTLLIKGSAKAGDLAKELGLHKLDVYNALRKLQSKDVVTSSLSKPMFFKAAPLENVIEILRSDREEDLWKKSEIFHDLMNSAERLNQILSMRRSAGSESGLSSNKIQIVGGRKAITEKWTKYLSSAKSEILIATTEKGTMQLLLLQSLDRLSQRMREDGLLVKIFTPISEVIKRPPQDSGIPVRDLVASNSAGLCIIDNKEVMMVMEQTENNSPTMIDETAVVIDSNSIVGMIRTMYFVGWDTSPPLEKLGKEIQTQIP